MDSLSSVPLSRQANSLQSRDLQYTPLDILPPIDTPTFSDYRSSTDNLIEGRSALHLEGDREGSQQRLSDSPFHGQPGIYNKSNTRDRLQDWIKDWLFECLSAAFSLACVCAMIVIFAVKQNKPLKNFQFLNITLNTAVATLSTMSRTALMVPIASCLSQLKWIYFWGSARCLREVQVFEDASRGPWGSVVLLYRLHFHTMLASLGSLLTILALAMGASSQQLLSYHSKEVHTRTAVIYRNQELRNYQWAGMFFLTVPH